MLFSLWPLPKVTAAILDLEEKLSEGVTSASSPTQGSLSYSSPDEARKILRALYRRHRELTGTKLPRPDAPRIFALRRHMEF